MKHLILAGAISALLVSGAIAQDAITVKVGSSDTFAAFLTDGEGRTVYLFTADTRGTGDTAPVISCSGECLDAWPPLYTEGDPQAGEDVDAGLLGTVEHDGKQVVTYNGWPLYYFVRDSGPGDTAGQEIETFGGEWYLVSPQGEKVEGE